MASDELARVVQAYLRGVTVEANDPTRQPLAEMRQILLRAQADNPAFVREAAIELERRLEEFLRGELGQLAPQTTSAEPAADPATNPTE